LKAERDGCVTGGPSCAAWCRRREAQGRQNLVENLMEIPLENLRENLVENVTENLRENVRENCVGLPCSP
jgi:hypothetical protein